MSYAIISVGGKQYRVREGERLLVDRLALEDGATFTPTCCSLGGDGEPQIAPADVVVTAKVAHRSERGPKIRIGKYKKRTGYKRHTGFRASLTQIQIESIGAGRRRRRSRRRAEGQEPPRGERAGRLPEGYAGLTVAAGRRLDVGAGRAALRRRSRTSRSTGSARARSRRSSPPREEEEN